MQFWRSAIASSAGLPLLFYFHTQGLGVIKKTTPGLYDCKYGKGGPLELIMKGYDVHSTSSCSPPNHISSEQVRREGGDKL